MVVNLLASGLVSALMGLVMLGVLYRTPRGALRKAACRAGGLEGMTTTSFYMRNCWNWQTGSVEVAVFIRTCGFKSHVPHQEPLGTKFHRTIKQVGVINLNYLVIP